MVDAAVLVAGVPGVGRATLLQGLGATQRKEPKLYDLHLDTKYYTADLVVRCDRLHRSTPPPAADQLQAVVFVVDASSESSFQDVLRYHKLFQDREFEIQLLVANKMDSLQHSSSSSLISTARPPWLQDARAWCYSNGLEYIEAAAGNPTFDAALQEDGEQQGVARVLAALQAHMWPNMQQKKTLQQQAPQHTAASATAAPSARLSSSSTRPTAGSAAAASHHASTRDQGTPAEPLLPPAQQQLQDQDQDATSTGCADVLPTPKTQQQPPPQQAASSQAAAAAAAPANTAIGSSKAGRPSKGPSATQQQQQRQSVHEQDQEDFLLNAGMDDFEQLMRQVMGARARLFRLPDAERRAAAADLALKLSMMMGGLGDSDEEGGDSEGEEQAAAAVGDDRLPQPDAVH